MPKRPYTKPRLRKLGLLREITRNGGFTGS